MVPPIPSGTLTFAQVLGIARPNTLAIADGLNVEIYSSVTVGAFDAEVFKKHYFEKMQVDTILEPWYVPPVMVTLDQILR